MADSDLDSDLDPDFPEESLFDVELPSCSCKTSNKPETKTTRLVSPTDTTNKLQEMTTELEALKMQVISLKGTIKAQAVKIERLESIRLKEREVGKAARQARERGRESRENNKVVMPNREKMWKTCMERLERLEEDQSWNSGLLQINQDLRWKLAELNKLQDIKDEMDRTKAVFEACFKNAGVPLVSQNGVYDLAGGLQLLLDSDKSKTKKIAQLEKELAERTERRPQTLFTSPISER
ncbi:hypothetical protein B0T20DRAFT_396854 [Sordaria brevicollis]|uniref:Uncharacterized protein n=1 Tax=Sordaria brevicollis TaxID=83679 RepID=A0AAE0P1M6_SORBR|nr:hypothetical protein B0T20DRAFT_396854 [Sordaria brevicollis]